MKTIIYRSFDGWRWRVVSRNGKIVGASSEAFARRSGAIRNLRLLTKVTLP